MFDCIELMTWGSSLGIYVAMKTYQVIIMLSVYLTAG